MSNLEETNELIEGMGSLVHKINLLQRVNVCNPVTITVSDKETATKIITALKELKAGKKQTLSDFINSNEFKEV